MSGDLRGLDHGLAIGPARESMPRARRVESPWREPDEAWRTTDAVDLDGDGSIDIEAVTRCGEYAQTGCNDKVCRAWCYAVRSPGAPVGPDVACSSFVPDAEDCRPD